MYFDAQVLAATQFDDVVDVHLDCEIDRSASAKTAESQSSRGPLLHSLVGVSELIAGLAMWGTYLNVAGGVWSLALAFSQQSPNIKPPRCALHGHVRATITLVLPIGI